MIPCIENKCISYPICLGKIRIYCPQLSQWFTDVLNGQGEYHHTEVWDMMKKNLPRLISISQVSVARFGEYEP